VRAKPFARAGPATNSVRLKLLALRAVRALVGCGIHRLGSGAVAKPDVAGHCTFAHGRLCRRGGWKGAALPTTSWRSDGTSKGRLRKRKSQKRLQLLRDRGASPLTNRSTRTRDAASRPSPRALERPPARGLMNVVPAEDTRRSRVRHPGGQRIALPRPSRSFSGRALGAADKRGKRRTGCALLERRSARDESPRTITRSRPIERARRGRSGRCRRPLRPTYAFGLFLDLVRDREGDLVLLDASVENFVVE
jgi:hypothetical protein